MRYASSSGGVAIDLMSGFAFGGDALGDHLFDFENVIGSEHSDTLFGDELANRLEGLVGFDFIDGGEGNDTIDGGAGSDMLDGGTEIDTVSYASASDWVEIYLFLGQGYTQGEADTLRNFENVGGSRFGDLIMGDVSANRLDGQLGEDDIYGMEGNDTLIGGQGDDVLSGGQGADVLDGGEFGIDTADYSLSNLGVTVNLMTGTASGGDAEGDTLIDIESIIGSSRNDLLTGSNNGDRLNGGAGHDVIRSGGGVDKVWLGAGNDTLVFNQLDRSPGPIAADIDTVWDFTAGGVEDVIDLSQSGSGFASLQDVLDNAVFYPELGLGNDGDPTYAVTEIDLGGAGLLRLVGVRPEDLTAADFIF